MKWVLLTVSIPIVLQLFFIRYVSYNVDVEVYGNFILIQALVVGLLTIFYQLPSLAFTRFYNTVEDKHLFFNEFRSVLVVLNLAAVAIVCIYGLLIDRYSIEIILLMLLYFLLLSNYSFNQQLFLLNLERKKYFVLKALEASAKFLFPIFFYYYYQSIEALLYGVIVGYVFSFLFLKKFLKRVKFKFKFNFNIENLKIYFTFAFPVFFVSVFSWGISFSDRYFIDYFLGSAEVGVYAILAQVAAMGQIIGQIYSMYVTPKVLNMYEVNQVSALAYLKKSISLLTMVFVIAGVLMFFIPTFLFEILIKPEIINNNLYYYSFVLLVFSIFVTLLQTALSMYLTLFKRLDVLAKIYLVAFIVNVLVNLYIDEFGIIIAAVSTLLAYIIILLLQLYFIKQYLNESPVK